MLLPAFIEALSGRDPEFYRAVKAVAETAMVPGALDAAHGASEGVAVLARQARDLGASEEEIREALRLAYFVAGNGVLAAGGAAYR